MDKPLITVSVMPTYLCNNNCNYCYLGGMGCLNNPDILVPKVLKARLEEVSERYDIERIELYGGDLSLVPENTRNELFRISRYYSNDVKVTWTAIELALKHGFKEEDINISINPERADYSRNTFLLKKHNKVGVITVVTDRLLRSVSPEELFETVLHNARGNVTLMPYIDHSNTPNPYVSNMDYSSYLLTAVKYYNNSDCKKRFCFTNDVLIRDCIDHRYSCAMRNNVFITPNGKFACIDFDSTTKQEYFHKFKNLSQWEERCNEEDLDRVHHCGTCEYYTTCLADHFKRPDQRRSYETEYDICNGLTPVIDWYKENIYDGLSYKDK